jgi:ABC-type phosphate transport system substrate-binding protein
MRHIAILMSFLGLLVLVATAQPAGAADFKIVVNASNPIETVNAAELGQFFLKKDTRWDSGASVEPVDQASGSAVRAAFSQKAHGKSANAVTSYWQRQIFSGRATPPPELSSDAEVLSFVRSHPWAIGYVSAPASVGDGLKVVRLAD